MMQKNPKNILDIEMDGKSFCGGLLVMFNEKSDFGTPNNLQTFFSPAYFFSPRRFV